MEPGLKTPPTNSFAYIFGERENPLSAQRKGSERRTDQLADPTTRESTDEILNGKPTNAQWDE